MIASHRVASLVTAVLAVVLVGCYANTGATNRTQVAPRGASVVVHHSIDDTMVEVTRLFQIRGYTLTRNDQPYGQRRLQFEKTHRVLEGEHLGEVFYASFGGDDSGERTTVTVFGKPSLADIQSCSNEDVDVQCSRLSRSTDLSARGRGASTQADVVHDILAQLQRDGYVGKQ